MARTKERHSKRKKPRPAAASQATTSPETRDESVSDSSPQPALAENMEQGVTIAENSMAHPDYLHDNEVTPIQEDIIRSFLGSYSRDPFQRQLAKFLNCAPDRRSIITFAKAHPDKWAKAVETFATLSGYTTKLEIDPASLAALGNLSDSQVESRLAELESILKGTPATIVQDK